MYKRPRAHRFCIIGTLMLLWPKTLFSSEAKGLSATRGKFPYPKSCLQIVYSQDKSSDWQPCGAHPTQRWQDPWSACSLQVNIWIESCLNWWSKQMLTSSREKIHEILHLILCVGYESLPSTYSSSNIITVDTFEPSFRWLILNSFPDIL